MKKLLFFLPALLLCHWCSAADFTPDQLLSLLTLKSESTTQNTVSSLLGAPSTVEAGKKRTLWHYAQGNGDLTISWNAKSRLLEKFSFKTNESGTATFDNAKTRKLKSGTTDINQAVSLLGTPNDVTVREKTQEMHYSYQQRVLRLFFRDKVLVDYCLY